MYCTEFVGTVLPIVHLTKQSQPIFNLESNVSFIKLYIDPCICHNNEYFIDNKRGQYKPMCHTDPPHVYGVYSWIEIC